MGGNEIDFKDKKTNKKDFYRNKKIFKIKDIDINEILISEGEPYGSKTNTKKFIIGYSDDIIRPLYISLHQMTGYFNCFKDNKTMSFIADDNECLVFYC